MCVCVYICVHERDERERDFSTTHNDFQYELFEVKLFNSEITQILRLYKGRFIPVLIYGYVKGVYHT